MFCEKHFPLFSVRIRETVAIVADCSKVFWFDIFPVVVDVMNGKPFFPVRVFRTDLLLSYTCHFLNVYSRSKQIVVP